MTLPRRCRHIARINTVVGHPGEPNPARIIPLDRHRAERRGKVNLFSLEERLSYLRKYGDHCMSFSILQPGMQFFDVPGMGFIAFREKWGNRLTLADPICHVNDREALLRELLREGPNTTFVQISQDTAELLHDRFGYFATQFGVEIALDLQEWNLKGKKKQILRTSVNHAKKEGIVIEEKKADDGCRQLTDMWLRTRKVKNREIGFLIRPMDMNHEEGTRKFFAYLNGELIGFIFFDPIYSDNRIIGYVPNISRFSTAFRPGIFYPLMIHAIEVFRQEGIRQVNLGLCPLVADEIDMPYESILQKRANRLMYEYGNWIFNFKGLYFTKSRFDGSEKKVFGAHRKKLPVMPFLTMFKLSNFF